MIESFI